MSRANMVPVPETTIKPTEASDPIDSVILHSGETSNWGPQLYSACWIAPTGGVTTVRACFGRSCTVSTPQKRAIPPSGTVLVAFNLARIERSAEVTRARVSRLLMLDATLNSSVIFLVMRPSWEPRAGTYTETRVVPVPRASPRRRILRRNAMARVLGFERQGCMATVACLRDEPSWNDQRHAFLFSGTSGLDGFTSKRVLRSGDVLQFQRSFKAGTTTRVLNRLLVDIMKLIFALLALIAVAFGNVVQVQFQKDLLVLDNSTYYEDPKNGCRSDELAVQITGIDGDFCSPKCTTTACPTDVPTGVTATPQCALSSASSTDKYCALICQPSGDDAQCGTNASCKSIQGVGICTYDD